MVNAMPFEGSEHSGLVSAKLLVDLLCFFTVPLTLFYAAHSYFNGNESYSLTLLAFCALVVASFFAYKFFGHWRLHRNFLVLTYSAWYFFLLISGGEGGTGILWLYAYPPLVFTILGLQAGTLVMASILSATICILSIPGWLHLELVYSSSAKLRFIGSMLFVTFMSFTMEKSRASAAVAHARVSRALEDLARTDELTGLLNRRGMSERIESELERSLRYEQEMSIVICDVDFFKKINDRYGHDIGDNVLVDLADRLKATVRSTDSVGRWGGEEFIILLPNTRIEKAYVLIERIRESIAQEKFMLGQSTLDVSISCGLASTKFSTEFSGLLKAADVSLYDAKEQGRNCTRPQVLKAS
jgi:diguanylate cyclase (GGDEF)-like protein